MKEVEGMMRMLHDDINNMISCLAEDDSGSDHDWEEQQIRKGVHQSSSNTQQHHSNNGRDRHITSQVWLQNCNGANISAVMPCKSTMNTECLKE